MKVSSRRLCLAAATTVILAGLSACGMSPNGGYNPFAIPYISNGPHARVVCQGTIDSRCALKSSNAARHMTAWILVEGGGRAAQLAVLSRRQVIQNLTSGSTDIQIASPPLEALATTRAAVRVRWGTDSGLLRIERAAGAPDLATLRWNKAGSEFQLTMIGSGLDVGTVLQLARQIRYSSLR